MWIKGSLGTQSLTLLSPACFLRKSTRGGMLPTWGIKPKRGIMEETESPRGEKGRTPRKSPGDGCVLQGSRKSAVWQGCLWENRANQLWEVGTNWETELREMWECFEGCELFLSDIKTKNKQTKRNIAPFPLAGPPARGRSLLPPPSSPASLPAGVSCCPLHSRGLGQGCWRQARGTQRQTN